MGSCASLVRLIGHQTGVVPPDQVDFQRFLEEEVSKMLPESTCMILTWSEVDLFELDIVLAAALKPDGAGRPRCFPIGPRRSETAILASSGW